MKLLHETVAMQQHALGLRQAGKCIGFVATMGALHAGHLALVRQARRECDVLIVSIFVNPTQFGPEEDFESYPRGLREDLAICREEGVDIVFAPGERAMYAEGFSTWVTVAGKLAEVLEGRRRPGHFRGVATVVAMLLHIIMPQRSYFGQKDYQQVLVVRKMVRDLHLPTEIVIVPTAREPDGLACSSRNQYLSASQRKAAAVLYRALQAGARAMRRGSSSEQVIARLRQVLAREAQVEEEYVAVVDAETMQPVARMTHPVVIALAARVGEVRLIDNVIVDGCD